MDKYSFLSEIKKGDWLIEGAYAQTMLPHVSDILSRKQFPAKFDSKKPKKGFFPTLLSDHGEEIELNSDEGTSERGVAIISMNDVIMRNDFCGTPGALTISNYLKKAYEADNVMGILLVMNCPGGNAQASKMINDTVAAANKPVISFCNYGLMCSAAYLVASPSFKIYAASNMCAIGSIGAVTSLKVNKDKDVKEIYAKQSTKKNKEYRAAQSGDYSLYEERTSTICEQFISEVKNRRPMVDDSCYSGDVYFGDEALKMGLIDGIKTIDEAIEEIFNEATGASIFE